MAGEHRKRDDWLELTQSAPGTPMGRLLRRFWQPVACSSDVEPGQAITVRALSEDLTLYRGQGGQPHLVAQRCAHRGTELRVGWIEDDCIRCFYHGWKYDQTGQCLEMPAEQTGFARKVKIAAYPVQEYAGVLFAYLGPGKAPAFPRRPELDREGVTWVIRQVWPCNWFQQLENSLDAAHVSFVHRDAPFGQVVTEAVPRLEYEETGWGILQRAIRSKDNVRESAFHWPNCNHVVVPRTRDALSENWVDLYTWKVPVDDEHTAHYSIRSIAASGDAIPKLHEWAAARGNYDPSDHEDELFQKRMPEDKAFLISAQDYLAQVSQGRVADRSAERLGTSDAGIILLRKLFKRELAAIKQGKPGKQWQIRDDAANLPVPPGVPSRVSAA